MGDEDGKGRREGMGDGGRGGSPGGTVRLSILYDLETAGMDPVN